MSSTSSVTSPTSTPTTQDATPKTDSRILAVVIILAIIGFFIISGVIYFTYRQSRKRRRAGSMNAGPYHGLVVDKDHPAALVTPFGSSRGEGPRFVHNPGTDMRIAIRRPDGAWHFASPRSPFTPTGISEPSPLPSPAASSVYLPLASPLPQIQIKSAKEMEVEAERKRLEKEKEEKEKEGRAGYGYDFNLDIEGCPNPPPPAYGYECEEDPFACRRL